ncbi:MAG: hypothetical protein K2X86_08155 [Cytophagaceae bacterium]|nr:hypothetical protein [Cytophagaceae bacterium]
MRKESVFSFLLSFVVLLFLNSCEKAPSYPETPGIEFKELQNYSSSNPVNEDSIVVTINFKDGDGDLGLRNEDVGYPYQEFDYKKDAMGDYIEKGEPGAPPYPNCTLYKEGYIDSDPLRDTVWIEPNPNYYNYFTEIDIKQADGSYLPFDFNLVCGPLYNGRFPLLNSLDNKGPIEGTLSHAFRDISYFEGETIRIKIYIQDRAFRKSNVVVTPDIIIN